MGLSLDAVKCDESLLLAQYAYSCMDCYRPATCFSDQL